VCRVCSALGDGNASSEGQHAGVPRRMGEGGQRSWTCRAAPVLLPSIRIAVHVAVGTEDGQHVVFGSGGESRFPWAVLALMQEPGQQPPHWELSL